MKDVYQRCWIWWRVCKETLGKVGAFYWEYMWVQGFLLAALLSAFLVELGVSTGLGVEFSLDRVVSLYLGFVLLEWVVGYCAWRWWRSHGKQAYARARIEWEEREAARETTLVRRESEDDVPGWAEDA